MYYICKFSDTWSVYDVSKHSSKALEPAEINCLKQLFPGLLLENKILTALQINAINPNKLLQLPATEQNPGSKKVTIDK